MNEEALIEEVKKYPFLYDLSDSRYSNKGMRKNAWEEIAETMEENAEDCKSCWRKLRENCRRAMLLRKTKSGQAANNKKIRRWTYEKQMEFLSDHFQDRSSHSNISGSSSSHSSQKESPPRDSPNNDDETDPDENNVDDDVSNGDDSNDDVAQTERDISTPRRDPVVNAKTNGTAPKLKTPGILKKSKVVRTPDVATALMHHLHNKSQRQRTEERKEPEEKKGQKNEPTNNKDESDKVRSPLMNFFITMAQTVETFPKKYQVAVKSKVFATVSDYESRTIELSNQENQQGGYEQFDDQNLYGLPNLYRDTNTDTRCYPIVRDNGETSHSSTSTFHSM